MDSLCSLFFVSSLLRGVDTPQALATLAAWPIHLATAASGGPAGVSWGYAIGAVITWLLTTAATWLVSARMTSAVLREQNRQLKESLKTLLGDVHALAGEIEALRAGLHDARDERSKCELRALKSFASKDEFARVLIELSAGNRELASQITDLGKSVRDSIGKVHGRVDGFQERLASLEGRTSITPRVPAELGEQAHA